MVRVEVVPLQLRSEPTALIGQTVTSQITGWMEAGGGVMGIDVDWKSWIVVGRCER
jgi:hypothetical protein